MLRVIDIERVSVAADGTEGTGPSAHPVFSPDGSKVAFGSDAPNLVDGDTNNEGDIFIKNLVTGETTRISTSSEGKQAAGASYISAFSPDGTKIAFESTAENLTLNDKNFAQDIFLKYLETGAIELVSTTAGGVQGNGPSGGLAFSPEGTRIALSSYASNLVFDDTNGFRDVFIKDLTNGAVARISTAADGTQANGSSYDPVFSPDGTTVAFVSSASNLVPGDTNGVSDLFVKDLHSGAIMRASTDTGGAEANQGSKEPIFSPDGTQLAFWSSASNLVPGDTNRIQDIYIKNLITDETARVSTAADGTQAEGPDYSSGARTFSFSPDSRHLAFYSWQTNLVIDDRNDTTDIFIKDLIYGDTIRVSKNLYGIEAEYNSDNFSPKFSPNGERLAFSSGASNLIAGDTNGWDDIFIVTLAEDPFTVSLVNTRADAVLAPILDGATLDPDTVPTRRSVSVDYAPGDAGSVTLELFDSAGRLARKAVENVAPYALFGDTAGDFFDPTAPVFDGAYTLRLTAHAGTKGRGRVLGADTLAFTLDEDAGSDAVTVSARVAVDGVQRSDRKLDTLQSGADDDIEAGGGYTGGFLFRDVAIPDGATVTAASIALVAERGRGAGTLDIRLSDDASNAGLSGTGALTKPGFDRFDPVAFALPALDAGDQVETPDLAALVGAVVARDPQADGTYDLLFALSGPSLRFFEPEEFGQGAVLTLSYETDLEPPLPSNVIATAVRGDSTYYLLKPSLDDGWWDEARADAQALGGDLVVINNAAENSFIFDEFGDDAIAYQKKNALPLGNGISLWLGLTDREKEGNWSTWVDGSPVEYENWGGDEPSSTDWQNFAGMSITVTVSGIVPGEWHDINDGPGLDLPFGIAEVKNGAIPLRPVEASLSDMRELDGCCDNVEIVAGNPEDAGWLV